MAAESLYHVVHKSPDAPSEGAPLLLLLHGYGADEEDLLGLAPHLDARLVCVSARAPYALDFGGFAWFNIEIGAEGVRFAFAEAEEPLAQVLSLVDALRRKHRPARVFIAGFSQGASVALAAALKRPRDFAGAIVLSGLCCPEMLPEDAASVRDLKVFMSHGRFDPVIPITQARSSRDLLASLELDLLYKEYDVPHAIAQPCLEDLDVWLRARLDTL